MMERIIRVENPIECSIVKRVNRFVVEICLKGKHYRAHINNTGRLHEFLVEGRKGFCVRNARPGKTDYRLFSIEEGDLGAIIDTQLQMRTFERALEMVLIPWLKGCSVMRRNARLGGSLIDYLLECNGGEVYLEVKSAALREGECAMYPDCPSSRGRKHIGELADHVKEGGRGIILFIGALPGVRAFRPNRDADPELYDLLAEARKVGVEIRSIGILYNPRDSFVYLFNPDLEVRLLGRPISLG